MKAEDQKKIVALFLYQLCTWLDNLGSHIHCFFEQKLMSAEVGENII